MKNLRALIAIVSILFLCNIGYTDTFAQTGEIYGTSTPECVNITIYGDPSSQMAFTWITDRNTTDGTIQIIARENASEADFTDSNVLKSVTVTSDVTDEVNYSIDKNGISGSVVSNQKIKYCSHKALATGLSPDTRYSFRVGKTGAWSRIGHFKTTKADNSDFSFIYVADTQATTANDFSVSAQTMTTAINKVGADNISFFLHTGDYVDGYCQSEWEYRQYFSAMEDTWLNHPMVALPGNHDYYNHYSDNSLPKTSPLFNYHFNTELNGTPTLRHNYSFRQGNALFIILDYEFAYDDELKAIGDWMRGVVAADAASANPARWRIACHHRGLLTGGPHQGGWNGMWEAGSENRRLRELMFPVYRELHIDLALQGHDHVYEVIGPVREDLTVSAADHELIANTSVSKENVTGNTGGRYNVTHGPLFFLNGAAGTKGYHAHDKASMDSHVDEHGVENYWGLFTGALGRPGYNGNRYDGLPTFTRVNVSDEQIELITYMVENGTTRRFDTVKVIKESARNVVMNISDDPTSMMNFNWITDADDTAPGMVQIVAGDATEADFNRSPLTFMSKTYVTDNLKYKRSDNQVWGWSDNLMYKCTSHKATASGLQPGTYYSFRVGNDANGWSPIGHFHTAEANNPDFSFLYMTDAQATTEAEFAVTTQTLNTALNKFKDDNPLFVLNNGDFVEGYCNSQWEYDEFMRQMKNAWMNIPMVAIPGNHDYTKYYAEPYPENDCKNFKALFNTPTNGTSDMGINYSFRQGNTLFIIMDFQHGEASYLEELRNWLRKTIEADNNSGNRARWRIVCTHSGLFTGGPHQGGWNGSWSEEGNRLGREMFFPLFRELEVDLSIQGHDHVYEVIGPVHEDMTTASTYTELITTTNVSKGNLTGRRGGIYNVQEGTLFFLNGASGAKKYQALDKATMEANYSTHQVKDYWSLFTGAFGRPGYTDENTGGLPTFSKINVTDEYIEIITYTVENGQTQRYDTFRVIKEPYHTAFTTINGDPSTRMGFSWLSHRWIYDGKLQILEGHATEADFDNGNPRVIDASVTKTPEMNYKVSANQLWGWNDDLRLNYRYHQAVADNLKPDTEYSYRVGFDNFGYGDIGYFRTAPAGDEPFRFLFLTDTQASTKESFDVSGSTLKAAAATAPDAAFILHTGDLANGYCNSEWEYEQFYRITKDANRNIPLAITPGNHDYNSAGDCVSFRTHFNTDKSFSYPGMPYQAEGATYSFRWGNALFLVLGFEHCWDDTYMTNLKQWLCETVEADENSDNPARWRIAAHHRTIFTGGRHQGTDNGSWIGGGDGKALRKHMLDAYDQCGIDVAIQGHDHIYEVIGPVSNAQMTVVPGSRDDADHTSAPGKNGRIYNLDNGGTLYFVNGSGSDNSSRAKTFAEMDADFPLHGVPNYSSLFTSEPIQTGSPMFTSISVKENTVEFSTFIRGERDFAPYDRFIVSKSGSVSGIEDVAGRQVRICHDSAHRAIHVTGDPETVSAYSSTGIKMTHTTHTGISTSGWAPGVYIVRATKGNKAYSRTIIVK